MPPTYGNGKICYIELPATDIARSAEFYKNVFGWNIRKRGDGATSFDDTVGEVSGAFVLGRPPASTPGLLFYVMVDNAAALYAKYFSAEELRAIEAFYRTPAGEKYMQNSRMLAEQSRQIGEESSRKAADDLKERMTQALREKGHKF